MITRGGVKMRKGIKTKGATEFLLRSSGIRKNERRGGAAISIKFHGMFKFRVNTGRADLRNIVSVVLIKGSFFC